MMNLIAGYKQHYKALIFLGLPIVIGQLGVIILGFADTLMIGCDVYRDGYRSRTVQYRH